METDQDNMIRLRRQALRPIETTLRNGSTYDHHHQIKELEDQEEEEDQQPLSPAGRLFHEPNFNVHILAIMGCKTKVDPQVAKANVKANLPRTLLKHPRFSSLPVS